MSVEDVFSIAGRGTVVSGRVERGVLKRDAEVEILGKGGEIIKTKVTDIETFKKSCEESRAGDNSGLLLRGVKREDIRRGMVVAKPGTVKAHNKFLVSLYILTQEEGGRHTGFHQNYRPQMFVRTAGMFLDNLTSHFHYPFTNPASDESIALHWTDNLSDKEKDSKMAMPGDNVEMVCTTYNPLCMEPGQRFNIREGGRTVATGLVTQNLN